MYAPSEDIPLAKVAEVWRNLFAISSGFVFAVDVTQLEIAGTELKSLIQEDMFSSQAPLLVLAMPPASTSPSTTLPSVVQIARALSLGDYKVMRWSVRYYEPQSMQGLVDGLAWVASCL
jgi:hypothetical protein